MLAFSILRMVIVRIPEDHGWVPTYPTSGTAIEFQFLSLFVIVSFLKVRVRARARKAVSVRSLRVRSQIMGRIDTLCRCEPKAVPDAAAPVRRCAESAPSRP